MTNLPRGAVALSQLRYELADMIRSRRIRHVFRYTDHVAVAVPPAVWATITRTIRNPMNEPPDEILRQLANLIRNCEEPTT